MSLTIYPGFKIDKTFSAYELLKFSKETIRPIILKSYIDLVKSLEIERMINILDVYHNYKILPKDIDIDTHLLILAQNLFYNKKPKEDEDFDIFEFLKMPISIFMYPLKDQTLIFLANDRQDYVNTFLNIDGIEEYSYWDNADKPDTISKKEWNKRRCDWEEALDNCFYFRENAIIFELVKKYDFIFYNKFVENLETFIPTDEQRIKYLEEYRKDNNIEQKEIKLIKITKEIFKKNIKTICDENLE